MAWSMPNAHAPMSWNAGMIPAQPVMPDPSMANYTPEQWAAMQQQNWQQWSQWQQQYTNWQQQYGEKYAQQMQSFQTMGGVMPGMPPLPLTNQAPPPAPPPPEKPPPPPHENDQPLFGHLSNNNLSNNNLPNNNLSNNNLPNNNLSNNNLPNNNLSNNMAVPMVSQPVLSNPVPGNISVIAEANTNWSNNVTIPTNSDNTNNANVNIEALNKLAEEERLFDIQFQKWEEEIGQWKKDNDNHPDKQAYRDYEQKFEACRAQLLERRKQMLLRRDKLLGVQSGNSGVVNNPAISMSNQNVPQNVQRAPVQNQHQNNNFTSGQNYSNQQNFSRRENSQMPYQNYNVNSQNMKDMNMDYNKSNNEYNNTRGHNTNPQDSYYDEYEENSNSGFINTNTSGGIPGLDLVPDNPPTIANPEVIDITGEKKQPDYTNISKGINNILGDEKIMNILSMVRSTGPPQQGDSNSSFNAANYTAPTPNNAWDGRNKQPDNSQQNMYDPSNMQMQRSNESLQNQNHQQYPQPPHQQYSQPPPQQYPQPPPQQQKPYGQNQGQDNFQGNNRGFQGNNRGFQANNQNYQDGNQNRQNQFNYNNAPNDYQQQLNQNQNQNMGNRGNSGLRAQNMQPNQLQHQNVPMNYQESKPNQIPPLMQPILPEKPIPPQWVEVPMFTPSIVVEYAHRPLRDKTLEFIDPVHTFDYDHKSKETDKTKEDIEREVDEELFSKSRDRRSPYHDPYERDRGYGKEREFFGREREPYSREKDPYSREREFHARERDVYGRDREPYGKGESFSREREPYSRDREPYSRERDPYGRERDLYGREREPFGKEREPFGKEREPFGKEREPFGKEREPFGREREPFGREREPFGKEREPFGKERETFGRERETFGRERDPFGREREPFGREREPFGREREPFGRDRGLGRDKEPFARRDDDKGRFHDERYSRREVSRDIERVRDRNRDHGSGERDSRKRAISIESDSSKASSKKGKVVQGPIATGFPDKNKHIVMIDDLLEYPGREVRPNKIVIILRGLPGSGKSYLAKLIRDREAELGGAARIMSIDDYFVQEHEIEEKDPLTGKIVKKPSMNYVYDETQEETYFNSLKRAFKRTLTDGYFNFLIMDAVNDQLKHYADIWNYARQNGFQVYICTLELDPQTCFKRNIHNRTLTDIEVISARFFATPIHHIQLDATTLLQNAAIEDVHMEDATDDVEIIEETQEVESVFTSKWEKLDDANRLARLDGTSKPPRSSNITMEDYLQLDEWTPNEAKPGKKTVRWADIEERREQEKMRAIGFVVGQTDWNRMTDPTMGSSALTKTKYIERVRRN